MSNTAIGHVAVIGAGVMGSAIGQTLASSGFDVACFDTDPKALARAQASVEHGRYGWVRAVELGKATPEEAEAARRRLRFVSSLQDAITLVDLVIEAIFEDLALKIGVFSELDEIAPASAILASNTSGLSITALAGTTNRAPQVIGWHWASPARVMPMAEIVRHSLTSQETVDRIIQVARTCGKTPVVINDQPRKWGFVCNRLYSTMIAEAHQIVAEGVASAEQVDQIMVDGFNWPVGPLSMEQRAAGGWQ